MEMGTSILIIGIILVITQLGIIKQPKIIRVASLTFIAGIFGMIMYNSYSPLNNTDMGLGIIGLLFTAGIILIQLVTQENRRWSSYKF